MELLLMIICISALIGFAIGVASGYMLATLGTTNQKTGVFSDKMDRAVETEGFSRTVEFSQREESSSTSYSSSARVTGEAFVTPYGSVYHSRRNCGKLKAAKTVGKFLPCMECGYNQPPTFFEDRLPQPVKRKWVPQDVAQVSGFFTSKGVWNCIGSELVFGLEFGFSCRL